LVRKDNPVAEKIEDRVSELERMMKNLAYAHMQTEMSLDSLSEEIRHSRTRCAQTGKA
jgi:hypothetical protein